MPGGCLKEEGEEGGVIRRDLTLTPYFPTPHLSDGWYKHVKILTQDHRHRAERVEGVATQLILGPVQDLKCELEWSQVRITGGEAVDMAAKVENNQTSKRASCQMSIIIIQAAPLLHTPFHTPLHTPPLHTHLDEGV